MAQSKREVPAKAPGGLVYRQFVATRLTHWAWVVCLFFMLLSGLQIFNAHPALYIGDQSGFEFDNAVLEIGAETVSGEPRGYTILLGQKYDTTGYLGLSGRPERPDNQAFPSWSTIPSFRDLATGRIVHFFFAWVLLAILLLWGVFGVLNGHIWYEFLPRGSDLRALPREIFNHLRFRFSHEANYNPLQKISYTIVMFGLFPLMFLTGLAMSPGMDSAWPWLLDIFGGRQTARTIHFGTVTALVVFLIIHILMVILAGPFNEMRSMISGWYRTRTHGGK